MMPISLPIEHPACCTQAVDEVPQSLVRELEGNDSMRAKFEALCRKAQNDICKGIEEVDGEAKVHGGLLKFQSEWSACLVAVTYVCMCTLNSR